MRGDLLITGPRLRVAQRLCFEDSDELFLRRSIGDLTNGHIALFDIEAGQIAQRA